MRASSFSLPDQNGQIHSLEQYRGRWLVLYFYPKDDTPGCTAEACAFRDIYYLLQEKGVAVLGVSADSVRSHLKFAQKFNLHFPLLSDPEKTLIKAYAAWAEKKLWGKVYWGILRKTVIISPKGEVVKEYPSVTPSEHAAEILKDLEALMN